MPQFRKKYGEELPNGTYQVTAPWQAGLSNGAVVGEVIGLMINGWVSERFGYRYTVIACLTLITGFIAIFFTAEHVWAIEIAEILCGVPWGVFQTVSSYPRPVEGDLVLWWHCLSDQDVTQDLTHVSDSHTADNYLRFRSLSGRPSWLLDDLGELLLGSRSSHWCRNCQVDDQQNR